MNGRVLVVLGILFVAGCADAAAPSSTSVDDAPEAGQIPVSTFSGGIAFVSARDGNRGIYVMNTDGTGETGLTGGSAFDRDPAWSPDGAKIAFMSSDRGNPEIYLMNADGSGQTRLTNSAGLDPSPTWSPE